MPGFNSAPLIVIFPSPDSVIVNDFISTPFKLCIIIRALSNGSGITYLIIVVSVKGFGAFWNKTALIKPLLSIV